MPVWQAVVRKFRIYGRLILVTSKTTHECMRNSIHPHFFEVVPQWHFREGKGSKKYLIANLPVWVPSDRALNRVDIC